ncbi:MAG TPA: hypothetical protein VM925_24785 [Labilithrix sp.]|nr:hypothetical protein [Labilithrix sp.]
MTTSNVALSPETSFLETPLEATTERRAKLSWGAVLGGLATTIGVWLLLTVLGLAINLSAVDPSDSAERLSHLGIATGIWSLVVWIVAIFAGATVAAYTAGVFDRPRGAMHGVVLWSLATLLSIFLLGGAIRTVIGGALATAESAVTGAAGVGQFMELDTAALVAPLNERLRMEGKPPVTPDQIQAALRTVTVNAVREGRLDKDLVIQALTERTSLSHADAIMLADDIESWFNTHAAVADDVRRSVLSAADSTGKALWWVFLAMTLGLGAAIIGATVGTSGGRQRRVPTIVPAPAPPLATTQEAHP